jgi:hypothetical protein
VSRKLTLIIFAILLSSLWAAPVSAQGRAGTAAPPVQPNPAQPNNESQEAPRKDVPEESADLAITANVTARELRFEVVPNPTVEFPGKPKRDTVWDAKRENLPPAVEPGVTYRNVGIRLKIASRFADIERIVAEALGEVPVTDEIRLPENTPRPNSPAPAPTPTPNGGRPR